MKKSLSLIVLCIFTLIIITDNASLSKKSAKRLLSYETALNSTVIILPPIIVPNKNTKKPTNNKNYNNPQVYALDGTVIIIPPNSIKQSKKIVVPTKRRAFETEYVQA